MTANTGVHTCSYYCERPECVRRQRDELRDRLEAALAQQPAAPSGAAASAEPAVWVAADTLNSPHPTCVSSLAYMSQLDRERGREYVPLYAAPQQPAAGDGCHCGTCTCNPNMTPAVRFDLSPAQMEGAIRDHLIRLGWTPPDEPAVSQQPEERGGGAAEPPSAPVGVDFAAVAAILRRAMRDGAHYGYRREFILQQALALEALSQQPEAVGMTKRELFTIAAIHILRAGDYAKWEHLAQDAVSLADATLAALAAQQQGGAE